jgi:hypothetical protein
MARRIARFVTPESASTPDAATSTDPTTSRPRRNTNGAADVSAARGAPSREEIAARAYEIYLARGGEDGYHEEDWLQAERELRQTDPAFRLPPRDGRDR